MVVILVSMVVFGVLLIWGAVASNRRDKAQGVTAKFVDLKLAPPNLIVGTARYPLAGVTARVEDSGQLSKRITATRTLATGVVALAWRKRVDDRSVFLTIEGPGVAIVREVRLEKDKNAPALARSFAASVNSRAAALTATAGATAAPVDGLPGQLAQLAALRDSGALSEAQFEAAKQRLIGPGDEQDEAGRAW